MVTLKGCGKTRHPQILGMMVRQAEGEFSARANNEPERAWSVMRRLVAGAACAVALLWAASGCGDMTVAIPVTPPPREAPSPTPTPVGPSANVVQGSLLS